MSNSNRAQSQFLRIYTSGGSDHHLWQNFYVNQSVTVSSKTHRYFPFAWGGTTESSAIGGQTIELRLPATKLAISAFEAAFSSKHLCELKTYEFDARLGLDAPQSGQTEIGSFLGFVGKMSGSLTELSVELGSTIAPVGAQIPSRTASNRLIGVPIQL
jgi:hypothetical protein|tara:strand:- start:5167 stop:5640 length:474 start_codon:yes stop_codon:yes gene_type:complete